jgi:hypothetical protein
MSEIMLTSQSDLIDRPLVIGQVMRLRQAAKKTLDLYSNQLQCLETKDTQLDEPIVPVCWDDVELNDIFGSSRESEDSFNFPSSDSFEDL